MNSSREYLHLFLENFRSTLSDGLRVLDAGSGSAPYRALFRNMEFETADHSGSPAGADHAINYVCDLSSIPVENERYDIILLTQVLEHVPEPGNVLKELYRILKPGGRMVVSAPLFYEEHDVPNDYYRYTQYGLKYLAEKAGFTVLSIEWMEGFLGTLAYVSSVAADALPLRPVHYGNSLRAYFYSGLSLLIFRPAFRLFSRIFYLIDRNGKYTLGGFCKNYILVVQK